MACAAALRDTNLSGDTRRITGRALVISSSQDPATPAAEGRWLSQTIRGAHYVELPVSHMSNIEASRPFNIALLEFLRAAR